MDIGNNWLNKLRVFLNDIQGSVCSVLLLKEARVISVDSQYLEPMRPRENDKCKIISEGEEEGIVVDIKDENDVVVLVGDRHRKYRMADLYKLGSKDQYIQSS